MNALVPVKGGKVISCARESANNLSFRELARSVTVSALRACSVMMLAVIANKFFTR
ncbi:hypothetical protein D3C87_2205080 [compost metagenome]